MSQRRAVFGRPYFDEDEASLLRRTIESEWIGQGPLVQQFEARLGAYVGAEAVVSVSSCTAALHLALLAAGVGPGDEVVTTPFTFVATINSIEHVGATAVLVDIDPDTLNIEAEAVEAAVTSRTRAIMPVHFGGRPVDTAAFYDVARRHDLAVIEDAAHAVGAVDDGRLIGGSGEDRVFACFSFYPNKNLASAEGGAVALNEGEAADAIRRLRLHGLDTDAWQRYRTDEFTPSLAVQPGFKYNWTDLQAAVALPQLEKLEGFLAVREYLADAYDQRLSGIDGIRPLARPPVTAHRRHALHLYQVVVERDPPARDHLVTALRRRGIGASVHYIGVNQHPYYRDRFGGSYPASDWATQSIMTLPLHVHLCDDDVDWITSEIVTAMSDMASAATG